MTPSEITEVLFLCFVVNYVLLIVWTVIWFATKKSSLPQWFGVSREDWNRVNLSGIIIFKSGVILLNFVPWLTMTFVHLEGSR